MGSVEIHGSVPRKPHAGHSGKAQRQEAGARSRRGAAPGRGSGLDGATAPKPGAERQIAEAAHGESALDEKAGEARSVTVLAPMLASLADAPLDDPHLVYEPKYDGIRAIAEAGGRVRLWSRLGNEKTRQFPEIVAALQKWAARLKEPVVLDGEIVALDDKGEPTGFQHLQGRIHLSDVDDSAPVTERVAYIVFDLLREGSRDLRERRLTERRAELERVFGRASSPVLRLR